MRLGTGGVVKVVVVVGTSSVGPVVVVGGVPLGELVADPSVDPVPVPGAATPSSVTAICTRLVLPTQTGSVPCLFGSFALTPSTRSAETQGPQLPSICLARTYAVVLATPCQVRPTMENGSY